MRYIGLDFETSGTDPWGDARPIQIGIAADGYGFESLIGGWDWGVDGEWSDKSEVIHKIAQDDLKLEKPAWKVDVLAAASLIEGGILGARMNNVTVGWNVAGFDRQFVTRWFPNLNRLLSYRTVDLNALCFALADSDKDFRRIKHGAKAYAADQMDPHGVIKWHDAYVDAEASLHSFKYLKGLIHA